MRERERERFTNKLTKELLTDHWNGFALLLHMSLKTISCSYQKKKKKQYLVWKESRVAKSIYHHVMIIKKCLKVMYFRLMFNNRERSLQLFLNKPLVFYQNHEEASNCLWPNHLCSIRATRKPLIMLQPDQLAEGPRLWLSNHIASSSTRNRSYM